MGPLPLLFALLLLFSSAAVAENVVHETAWSTSQEMEKILVEMDGNRLFPCFVEGRVNGIKIEYKGAYCPFTPGLNYFYSRWGMSEDWYQHYKQLYEQEGGMKEYSHSTFFDLGGNLVHQATWILLGE